MVKLVMSNILKKMIIGRAFSNEKGRIRLYGKMDWSLIPSWVFGDLLQYIGDDKGADYLYDFGYKQGIEVAEEMTKAMGYKPKGGWLLQNAVVAVLEFIGFGRAEFVKSEMKQDGRHHIVVKVKDHPVVEHSIRKHGDKSIVIEWFMGVYAAHLEVELGVKNSKLREIGRGRTEEGHYFMLETKW